MNNVDLFLIAPYQKSFFDPIYNEIKKYWAVFDENKKDKREGYLIFYSKEDIST
jgi:hypothetical protein